MKFRTPFFIVFFCAFLKHLISSVQLRINSTPHLCNPFCDGSSDNPFETFGEALANISSMNETSIQLIFATSKNNTYYLNASDLSQLVPDQTSGLYYIGKGVNYVSLMPENCIYNDSSNNCLDPNVNLVFNTEMVVFQVNIEFTVYHVDINGIKNQASVSTNNTNVQMFGLFEVKISNQDSFLRFIKSSMNNHKAVKYSYLIWISSITSAHILNLSCIDSNFIGLSFSEQLMNFGSNTNKVFIEITRSNFSQINCSWLFYSEASGIIFNVNQSEFSNLHGNILYLISDNNITVSFSKIMNVITTRESIFHLFKSNTIFFNGTIFSSITADLTSGGVIHINDDNKLNIFNINCQKLSANIASFLFADTNNIIFVNQSSFSLGSSVFEGGVFYLNSLNKYIGNTNNFSENQAWNGGVMYSNISNYIYDEFSIYFKNNALKIAKNLNGSGGVFAFFKLTNFILKNLSIEESASLSLGGVLYLDSTNNGRIYNVSIKNSKSNGYGGIIYSSQLNNFSIDGCQFSDSYSSVQAGMIGTWTNNSIVLTNSVFRNGSSSVSGFTFLTTFNTFQTYNCNFTDFNAQGFGGVVGTFQNNQIEIYNTSFKNTYCNVSGGAVFLEDKNNFTAKSLIFQNSTAGESGGVLQILTNNEIIMTSCYFLDTTAKSSAGGGALYVINSNNITMKSCVFDHSIVTVHGTGGVVSMNHENNLNFSNNTYMNSQSPVFGGIIYMRYNNSFVDDNSSYHNISVMNSDNFLHNGGCFHADSYNSLNLTNCDFTNISTENSGGIFYLSLLNILDFKNITFFNISANFAGALLFAEDQNTCFFKNLTGQLLTGNLFGTGFYALFNNFIYCGHLYIKNINNTGSSGGFAYIKHYNLFIVNDSDIGHVFTKTSGGFFYAEVENKFVFYNLTLHNITTEKSGGLIFLTRNNYLLMNDSKIQDINSGFRGGAVFAIYGNNMVLRGLRINSISGLDFGCLFYLMNLNVIYVENSSIVDLKGFINSGNMIFLEEGNIVNWIGNQIINFQDQENLDYFYGVQNNTIYMKDNSISSKYSQVFLNLKQNHTLKIYSMKILANSTFNTFISLVNGYMYLEDFFMKFNVYHVIFNIIENSFAVINKTSMMPANKPSFKPTSSMTNFSLNYSSFTDFQANLNEFILIYLKDSQLKLIKSTIQNTFGINLNSIYALNSSIYIKKVLSFGMKTLHSGAFVYLIDFNMSISKSVIIASKALSGGCIYMNFSNSVTQNTDISSQISKTSELLVLNMNRNVFKMNRARFEGGVLKFTSTTNENSSNSFSVNKNLFKLNKAWTGGVISLNNLNSGTLKGNFFLNNSVEINNFSDYNNSIYYYNFTKTSQAKGGAIHTENSLGIVSQNNTYFNNKASLGGAIYSSSSILHINDTFENNFAQFYGEDLASLAKNLTFLLPTSVYGGLFSEFQIINHVRIDDLVSGANLSGENECILRIAGLDEFSNLAFNSDQQDAYASKISFKNTNSSNQYTNTLFSTIKNGQFCLLGAQRDQLPMQIPFTYQVLFNEKPTNLTLKIIFRDCKIGERLTYDHSCVVCNPGYYSFQTVFNETSICIRCKDKDPFVSLGGDKLIPKQGFWRSDSSSKNFVKCSKPDVCIPFNETLYEEALTLKNSSRLLSDLKVLINLGSLNSLLYTGTCKPGFIGPFCNQCHPAYGKIGKVNCILCADSSWFYYLLIVLQIVIKLWYLFYCVLIAFKMIITITLRQASQRAVIAINMLKILLIHVQILSFMLKMPLDWSDNLKNYLPILFSFSPDISEAFNFECFMKSIGWNSSEQYFVLILWPGYIFLIFFVSLLIVGRRKNSMKNPIVHELSNFKLGLCVFFSIMILTFIDLSKVNLEMFQCLNIADPDKPDSRLANDVGVDCRSFNHKLWEYIVAVPVLFLCFLFVIFIVSKLTLNFMKNKMDSKESKLELGYFYYAYKKKYFFWDFVILIRRLMILFFFLFFYQDLVSKSMYPILLIILTLFGSLALQIYIHPFETQFEIVNSTEQNSLISLCLSYVIMMMYATFYFQNYDIPDYLFFITILSILVMNLIFFIYWVYNYYVYYFKEKVKSFMQAIKDTVRTDDVVWMERLKKEHHVIFKMNHYFFKKQFLLIDFVDVNTEYNEFLKEESKNEIRLMNLYAKLLSKTLKKNKDLDNELFKSKWHKRPEFENMIEEPKILKLRLGNANFKQALFEKEVVLYESHLWKLKITYKKLLKGKNYYTYFLINEIQIISESEGVIKYYDIEKNNGLFSFDLI